MMPAHVKHEFTEWENQDSRWDDVTWYADFLRLHRKGKVLWARHCTKCGHREKEMR